MSCFRLSTKERREYNRFHNLRRSARKKGSHDTHTRHEWHELKKKYANTCLDCGRAEPEITLTEDHVTPLSKGGSDGIENIQPLCLQCNCRKNSKNTDFRELRTAPHTIITTGE